MAFIRNTRRPTDDPTPEKTMYVDMTLSKKPARPKHKTKKKHENFVQEEEEVREFGVTSHMPALEREVEHACGEEDPASDKQTSTYE